MRQRCNNSKNDMYYLYGGRGIKVCKEWQHNFWSFYEWCLKNYKEDCSIDRINNNGNYSPANCRFATPYEQQSNARKTVAKRMATKKALAVLRNNPHLRTKGLLRDKKTGRFYAR